MGGGSANKERLVAVFGRDAYGLPLKRTLLCRDAAACRQLKAVIHRLLEHEEA